MSNHEPYIHGPKVFQRGDKRFLAFYAQPVWDMDEFERLCPQPSNPHVYYARDESGKGTSKVTDWEHPEYLHAEKMRDKARWGYVILKTLEPSILAYMEDVEVEEEVLDDDGNVTLDENEKPVTKKAMQSESRVEPLVITGCSLTDPKTWPGVDAALEDMLGYYEYNQISALVHDANSINQSKLEDNLESFFQITAQHTTELSHQSGPSSTSDSALASDSE